MNNYIILENRAELTTAQVLGGMNFSAIVAGATSATSDAFGGNSFGMGYMSKGFLAVLIVVAGVAVYKNHTAYNENSSSSAYTGMNADENVLMRDHKKGPVLMVETIPPKDNRLNNTIPNMACQPSGTDHDKGDIQNHMTGPTVPLLNGDSIKAAHELKSASTITTPSQIAPIVLNQMVPAGTCRKDNEGNGMIEEKVYTTTPFNASPNAKSYLWQPASFNHNVESASGNFKLDCNGCDFNYISGTQLDGKNYKGVWMRVTRDKNIKFKLETGLKNISLIRTEGIKSIAIHPIAVGIDGPQWREKEWTYISNKFKTGSATYNFGDHIDIYMIFENAKVGDKLVIDDFVETLVVEK